MPGGMRELELVFLDSIPGVGGRIMPLGYLLRIVENGLSYSSRIISGGTLRGWGLLAAIDHSPERNPGFRPDPAGPA